MEEKMKDKLAIIDGYCEACGKSEDKCSCNWKESPIKPSEVKKWKR